MGQNMPHPVVQHYQVDEVIETLPFDNPELVAGALMKAAPKAYDSSGVPLMRVWWYLPDYVQHSINKAAAAEYAGCED